MLFHPGAFSRLNRFQISKSLQGDKAFHARVPQLCSQGSNNLQCLDIQSYRLICDHYSSLCQQLMEANVLRASDESYG